LLRRFAPRNDPRKAVGATDVMHRQDALYRFEFDTAGWVPGPISSRAGGKIITQRPQRTQRSPRRILCALGPSPRAASAPRLTRHDDTSIHPIGPRPKAHWSYLRELCVLCDLCVEWRARRTPTVGRWRDRTSERPGIAGTTESRSIQPRLPMPRPACFPFRVYPPYRATPSFKGPDAPSCSGPMRVYLRYQRASAFFTCLSTTTARPIRQPPRSSTPIRHPHAPRPAIIRTAGQLPCGRRRA